MILLCFDFLVFIVRSKYHDPLHVLLDYIAKVSAADVPFVFICDRVNSHMDGAAGARLRYGRCSR